MARGKIEIKRIENSTNRQVTYSKRRNGLFKKANELTVLCDAKVSIIMFSSTNKLHEYLSPFISTKQVFDQYQNQLGIDLWQTHFERMQEHLKQLKDVNNNLRMEIRHRMGASLDGLSLAELRNLEEEMDGSLDIIRERKRHVIGNQIDTLKKKVRNSEEVNRKLVHEFDVRREDPHFGLVENGGSEYDTVFGYQNGGGARIFALPMQNNQANPPPQPLHSGGGFDLPPFALLE
uniref:AP3 MADS box protein n=2 Tax=Pentapetalae TaxID=1437201 RepID=A0A023VUK1_9MAGN|nr:AP3 MADS box protein [Ribes diacanthum]